MVKIEKIGYHVPECPDCKTRDKVCSMSWADDDEKYICNKCQLIFRVIKNG